MSDLIKCIVVMNKAEALNDSDEVCNKNVIAIEEDTGFIKKYDGVRIYRQLPYLLKNTLPDELFKLFKEVNKASCVPVLDDKGKLPSSSTPDDVVKEDDAIAFVSGNADDAVLAYEAFKRG